MIELNKRKNMEEESQSEYKTDGAPVTEDDVSKRIGERIKEIAKERQRRAYSRFEDKGPSVWTDEGLKQLLEIQGRIHSNKGAIARQEVRKQISQRTDKLLRSGRKIASLDSEHGLKELYGLLRKPDSRVPTDEERVAREIAPVEEVREKVNILRRASGFMKGLASGMKRMFAGEKTQVLTGARRPIPQPGTNL